MILGRYNTGERVENRTIHRQSGEAVNKRECRFGICKALLLSASCFALVLINTHCVTAQTEQEIALKVAFVSRFINYVTWPEIDEQPGEEKTFLISVVGDSVHLGAFEKLSSMKTARGQRVEVRRGSIDESLRTSQVVFIATPNKTIIADVLKYLERSPTLTISSGQGFVRLGTMINFLDMETGGGRKLRFEINNRAAKTAGLKISSHLLKLAVHVENTEE